MKLHVHSNFHHHIRECSYLVLKEFTSCMSASESVCSEYRIECAYFLLCQACDDSNYDKDANYENHDNKAS